VIVVLCDMHKILCKAFHCYSLLLPAHLQVGHMNPVHFIKSLSSLVTLYYYVVDKVSVNMPLSRINECVEWQSCLLEIGVNV